jgi:thymidylate kinase
MEFLRSVLEKYLQLVIEEPERFFIIDASFPEEIVAEKICPHLLERFTQ